jgi:polar amino acid transport system permease protein
VLPQATRVIIPPTGNEFIAMMKDTALVSFLGVQLERAEIFRRAQLVGNQDLRKLEALIIAAGMYWGLTALFTFFQRKLERRMGRGFERTVEPGTSRRPKLLSMGQPHIVPEPVVPIDAPGEGGQ